jgi:hypothetical protein
LLSSTWRQTNIRQHGRGGHKYSAGHFTDQICTSTLSIHDWFNRAID